MKNSEVQQLQRELAALVDYCVKNEVKNFTLNRILRKNSKIIDESVNEFREDLSQDLKDLVQKISDNGKIEFDKLSDEEKKKVVDLFNFGLGFASEEDKEKYEELNKEYIELMNEESDIHLYILEDTSKVEKVDLPLAYDNVLAKFLKED